MTKVRATGTKTMIAAAAVLLATAGGASAQRAAAPNPFDPARIGRGMDQLAGMAFDELARRADVDGNGALSMRELAAAAARGSLPFAPDPRSWRAFDLDGDGQVVRAEVVAAVSGMRGRVERGGRPY